MNKIRTYEEYRAQGFKENELWVIRKTDCMFNNWDNLTEREKEKYSIMVNWLGL